MKTTATLLAALLAASFAALPATAQISARAPIVINHADLDLSTAEGRGRLDLRILHASRTACGTPSPADPRGAAKADQCVTETRAAAAVQRDAAIALAMRSTAPVLASGQ
jgi:UrcA family protein